MTSAIAKAIIISHVIIFGSTAYTGSYQEMECQYLIKQVDTCWERYTSLPVCEIAYDPLIQCAENNIFAAQRMECSSEIQKDLKMFWKIYVIMKESLCSDEYLYKEFRSKSSCWSVVRNCSAVVAFSLDREKTDGCNVYLENVRICYYKSQTCSEVLQRFGAALATGTPCSEIMEVEFLQIRTNTAVALTFHIFTMVILAIVIAFF